MIRWVSGVVGREAMSGRVLVDPEKRYLMGQPTTEKLKNTTTLLMNLKGLKWFISQ